jgi:hypothetical protein
MECFDFLAEWICHAASIPGLRRLEQIRMGIGPAGYRPDRLQVHVQSGKDPSQ